ncbi:MAG: hypothetical protein BAJALOKI3v1_20110 [Promethearchaeota archaeon]|nr:MAG: hypothetical protein BAJALOKI3v1_20110 [Candidatus Lokiarchaeota archaeon]
MKKEIFIIRSKDKNSPIVLFSLGKNPNKTLEITLNYMERGYIQYNYIGKDPPQ